MFIRTRLCTSARYADTRKAVPTGAARARRRWDASSPYQATAHPTGTAKRCPPAGRRVTVKARSRSVFGSDQPKNTDVDEASAEPWIAVAEDGQRLTDDASADIVPLGEPARRRVFLGVLTDRAIEHGR